MREWGDTLGIAFSLKQPLTFIGLPNFCSQEKKSMRIKDLSRRELLKLFGITVGGSLVGSAGFPLNVQAQSKKVTPRKNVRNIVFVQNCGAMSPHACLDFKETRFTAKDLNIEKCNGNPDFLISRRIFPNYENWARKAPLSPPMYKH